MTFSSKRIARVVRAKEMVMDRASAEHRERQRMLSESERELEHRMSLFANTQTQLEERSSDAMTADELCAWHRFLSYQGRRIEEQQRLVKEDAQARNTAHASMMNAFVDERRWSDQLTTVRRREVKEMLTQEQHEADEQVVVRYARSHMR